MKSRPRGWRRFVVASALSLAIGALAESPARADEKSGKVRASEPSGKVEEMLQANTQPSTATWP
jgi:hypothetical protein